MMRGLVYHQPAGIPLVPMPAPKIVRSVSGIEQPFEVDRFDLANDALQKEFLHLRAGGRIAVVESHPQLAPAALHSVKNGPALNNVRGHWLFGNDVATALHRPNDVVLMDAIDRGDYDHLRFLLCDHAIEISGQPSGDSRSSIFLNVYLVMKIHSLLVDITDSYQS